MIMRQSKYLPAGRIALVRNGKVVWMGALSAPWEDVDCDTIIFSPSDHQSICDRVPVLPSASAKK